MMRRRWSDIAIVFWAKVFLGVLVYSFILSALMERHR